MVWLLYVSTHPNLNQAEFVQIARVIKAKNPDIRSINLSKNTVISHIYPLRGNESALGVNLAATPHLKKVVEQTIKTKKQIVAGPANFVQGDIAFINRTVVFVTTPDGKPESGNYWGLVSVLVKPDVLYKKAGLLDCYTELN